MPRKPFWLWLSLGVLVVAVVGVMSMEHYLNLRNAHDRPLQTRVTCDMNPQSTQAHWILDCKQ